MSDEEFCPDCFAGMESNEHHEKCVAMPLCECGHINDRHGLGGGCILRGCDCYVYRPIQEMP